MQRFALLGLLLFAALPSTSNYRLNSYGFGSGGTAGSQTATYSLEGSSGEFSGATSSTSNYKTLPGFIETEQANVPQIGTLDNNGGIYYNKLHFVIDTQNNPTDSKYLISVSTDNFSSDIKYLQPDGTLTSTLSLTQYQTYSAWGGSGGGLIIGLLPSTTYQVRARATQGKFSESRFGPAASQATAAPSITFSLVTSTQSSPPFTVDFGTLPAGSIASSSNTINTTLSTNGASGGDVYIRAQNGGLLSSSTGYRIDSVTNDLSSLSEGFGAQNSSVGQSSGGPYSVVSPFNVTGTNVASITTITRSLYTTTGPVTNGSGVLLLKAKAASTDVAATDYREILTFIAAGNF
jgi:hypothetical protein